MVMGRHRGLPESIDPSVRLPSIPELAMAKRSQHKKLRVTLTTPQSNSSASSDSESVPDLKEGNEGDVIIDMPGKPKLDTNSDSETTTTKASKEPISSSMDFTTPIVRRLRRHASLESISLPSAKRRSKEKDRAKEPLPVPFEVEKRLSTISLASNHTVRSDLGFDIDFLEQDEESSSEDLQWKRRAYSLDDADRVEYN